MKENGTLHMAVCEVCSEEFEINPKQLPRECPACGAPMFGGNSRVEASDDNRLMSDKEARIAAKKMLADPEATEQDRETATLMLNELRRKREVSGSVATRKRLVEMAKVEESRAVDKQTGDTSSDDSGIQKIFSDLGVAANRSQNLDEWFAEIHRTWVASSVGKRFGELFGVGDNCSLAQDLVRYLIGAIGRDAEPGMILLALETIRSLKPENGMQSLLAMQMASCHFMATRAVRAAVYTESLETQERKAALATKLMRLGLSQMELYGRLQGKIAQQRVIVERLDVRDGGQAIVGNVGPGAPPEGHPRWSP